jgi:membrane protease YdiL (CAAX protease family)
VSRANALLYTPAGGLRAPWRILFFLAVTYVTAFLLTSLIPLAIQAGIPVFPPQMAIYPVILPLSLLIAHHVSLRWIDRRGWDFIAADGEAFRPKALAFGTVLGTLPIAIPTLVLLMAGQFALRPTADESWLAATLKTSLFLLPAALWEELLFRGYPFAVIREAMGWKWALLVTSFAFGLVHIQNGGAGAQNITIVIVAGFLIGLILLVTKSFYAAWAAHFAWNWIMACGFHVSVSGNPFERPDYELVPIGPDWLTGGPWGPEGGLGAGVGLFAAVFYVYGRYLKPKPTPGRTSGPTFSTT